MKKLAYIALSIGLLCCFPVTALGQSPAATGQTVVVIPFENASGAPGTEWISEAFPEILGERLSLPTLYVLSREERLRAYDRMGIPAAVRPSRATLYRVAEQLDVDYVVLGRYLFDGHTFTAWAQVLDMRRERLSPEVGESGALTDLMRIQTLLAWSLLRTLQPDSAGDRSAFVAEASPIRLDAFESFVRGVTDSSPQQRIQRFREAVRLAPNYRQAWLELGETYYSLRDYAQAVAALGHVPPTGSSGREAGFYLGLASFYQGDFARAESAFRAVTASLPLPEIYNNLGVATAPRSARESATHFAKAVDDDPTDADYRFNLGLALFRAGDFSGAARQLKESLALRPSDAEAKSMLQAATSAAAATTANAAPASAKLPPQRLKSSYDENAFRQLSVKLQAAVEARLAKSDAATHARYHVARGQEFLAQGFTTEAVQNLREAVVLDPGNPEAHAALARALEAASDTAEARTEARREAEAALRLKSFAEPLLVLVRLDLRENKTDEAAHSVDQALQLEPGNSSAQALKRSVAAKLAEKAQPLPNP